jgi:hypothetical protein
MATQLTSDVASASGAASSAASGFIGGGIGETALAATGFGPGTIVIALIGGVLTLVGAIMHRFGRRPAGYCPPAPVQD